MFLVIRLWELEAEKAMGVPYAQLTKLQANTVYHQGVSKMTTHKNVERRHRASTHVSSPGSLFP